MNSTGLFRASRLLPAAALAAILVAACSTNKDIRPTIELVSPADGSVIDARTIEVTVAIERFTLTNEVFDPLDDESSVPFFGHWHLFIDFEYLGDVFEESVTVTQVPPGEHSVIAQLVNQNHFPIAGTPYSEAIITIPAGLDPV